MAMHWSMIFEHISVLSRNVVIQLQVMYISIWNVLEISDLSLKSEVIQ